MGRWRVVQTIVAELALLQKSVVVAAASNKALRVTCASAVEAIDLYERSKS
jgi:hypothetical protein